MVGWLADALVSATSPPLLATVTASTATSPLPSAHHQGPPPSNKGGCSETTASPLRHLREIKSGGATGTMIRFMERAGGVSLIIRPTLAVVTSTDSPEIDAQIDMKCTGEIIFYFI